MPVSGGMRVTPLPSGLELSAGAIDKLELRGTSGINSAVGASLETICTQGGIRNLLTSAEQLKIKSSSADDTNSGSGHARRVKIKGIDGSGVEQEENVNLNGTAAVTTVNSYRHINDIFVNKVGSGGDVNEYLYLALVLAEGEVHSISNIEIDAVTSTDSRFSSLVTINQTLDPDNHTSTTHPPEPDT